MKDLIKLITILSLFLFIIPSISAYSIDTTIEVYLDGYTKVSHIINIENNEEKISLLVYSLESLDTNAKYDDSDSNSLILFPEQKKQISVVYLTNALTKKDEEWKLSYQASENEKVKVIMPLSSRILSQTAGYVASKEKAGKVFEWRGPLDTIIEYNQEFAKLKGPGSILLGLLIPSLGVFNFMLCFFIYRKRLKKRDNEIEFLEKTKSNPVLLFRRYYNLLEPNDKRIVNLVLVSPHLRISRKKLRKDITRMIQDKKDNESPENKVKAQQASAQQIKRGLDRLMVKSERGKYGLFKEDNDVIEFSQDAKQTFSLDDAIVLREIRKTIKSKGKKNE